MKALVSFTLRCGLLALALTLALTSKLALAAPDLVISGYQLQSTKRLSLTLYEYTYQVRATNRGSAAASVEAQVASLRSWLVPTSAALYFGNVGAGQTVTSLDTFVIRHDRRFRFTATDIEWRFVASDATFIGRFEGVASTPVETLLVNYVDDTPYAPAAVQVDAAGQRVLRTELSIVLVPGATVGQIQPVLDSAGATVIATLAGRNEIIVRIPDPGSLVALENVRQTIAVATGILSVDLSVFPVRLELPSNARFQPQPPNFNLDRDALSRFLGHHLAIRAHAAWNVEGRLNRPVVGAPLVQLPLLIVADYFGNGPPRTVDGYNVLSTPRDYATGRAPSFVGPGGYHGYEVLGVAAASFGGGETPLEVSTGIVPATNPIVLRAVDLELFSERQAYFRAILTIVSENPTRTIVLNTSLGGPASSSDRCSSSGCVIPTFAERRVVEADAVKWVRLVRGDNPAALSLESRFLHVTSAGNNPAAIARDVSAFSHAGTQAEVVDTRGTFRVDDDVRLPGLTNVLVVEGRFAEATNVFGAPPVIGCPNGTVLTAGSLGQFTPGGHVSGIGSVNRGLVLVNGVPALIARGVYAPYTTAKTTPTVTNYDTFVTGSSVAAPQAAGVALYAWALRPGLRPQEIKNLIIATAVRSQSGPGFAEAGAEGPPPAPDFQCPGPPGFHPTVDAYAAVLATDSPGGTINLSRAPASDAPVRLALLDIAKVEAGNVVAGPDGKFTQADIILFLREFEASKGTVDASGVAVGALDYSRFDLNGNGRTGETYVGTDIIERRRFDLDGDLSWTRATQNVEGKSVSFDEYNAADISVLVHYAYSPLYTGNEYERAILLLPYLRVISNPAPFLSSLAISVTGIVSTNLQFSLIEDQTTQFSSLCPGGERGTYSQVVVNTAQGQYPRTRPTFWRPLNQFGRIADRLPNAQNCSSFIATIGSSGKVWINSVSRTVESGLDVEYQSRFYLGEPDLTAGSVGSLMPPPNRLATQALTYGVIDSPGATFRAIANTRDFRLQAIGLE